MENASKALLIAGQVLIAILLLTLFSYLFSQMHEDTSKIQEQLEQNEKLKFNQQFLVFDKVQEIITGKDEAGNDVKGFLTAQDVATIMNLAKENNKAPKFSTTIVVQYGVGRNLATEDARTWLEANAKINKKYGCNVHINQTTLVVDNVKISDI